jgi:hypothetical protein
MDCNEGERRRGMVSKRRGREKSILEEEEEGRRTHNHVVNLLDTEPVKDVGHENLEAHVWRKKIGGREGRESRERRSARIVVKSSVYPAREERGKLLRKGRAGRRKKNIPLTPAMSSVRRK